MDGGLFGIYANTGEKEVEALMSLLCREIEKVQRDVTSEEVNRSCAQLKASILMSLESTFARCEQLARQIMVFGRPLPIAEIVEKVEAVDAAAVMRLAGRIFGGTPTQAALGPLSGVKSYDKMTEKLG
jgi:predicted Zn-dependent peptidase